MIVLLLMFLFDIDLHPFAERSDPLMTRSTVICIKENQATTVGRWVMPVACLKSQASDVELQYFSQLLFLLIFLHYDL